MDRLQSLPNHNEMERPGRHLNSLEPVGTQKAKETRKPGRPVPRTKPGHSTRLPAKVPIIYYTYNDSPDLVKSNPEIIQRTE